MEELIESLWCLYEEDPDEIDAEFVWPIARNQLEASGVLEKKYSFDSASKSLRTIDKKTQFYRNLLVSGDKVRVLLNTPGYSGYRRATVSQKKSFKANWDKWVLSLSKPICFTMSYFYDITYQIWQNEESIDFYKRCNRSYDHLKVIPSGRPARLPEWKLDITPNVGRIITKKGYEKAACATMWLGDRFFELNGADKDKVMNTRWLIVEQVHPHVIKIKAQEEAFTTDTGKERELQIMLRELLYPNRDVGQ